MENEMSGKLADDEGDKEARFDQSSSPAFLGSSCYANLGNFRLIEAQSSIGLSIHRINTSRPDARTVTTPLKCIIKLWYNAVVIPQSKPKPKKKRRVVKKFEPACLATNSGASRARSQSPANAIHANHHYVVAASCSEVCLIPS
ncbi:uncharacterized protein MYCFIDRAFT_207176 [Pseudocercospora fijiensis CIRAD86]|uniref:Uncharacterized protein n=1 Tax=Pseudocercospora fijiensis (strain CIRAD86) TaxID=383855 RepID=M3B439_PSEFD|nr:uncharacterized protein MYCFIDRAFT_207176 [Pseudocercospora fijiensis CIRAD86]EME84122.1 hypothetical protein MYCFIDRAFT_207176 [Pseudocercospora fijiensis CIRAD86]